MLTGKAHPGYIYWKFLKVGVKFQFSCHGDCLKCIHKIHTSALKVARCSWVTSESPDALISHVTVWKSALGQFWQHSAGGWQGFALLEQTWAAQVCAGHFTALGLIRFNTLRVTSTEPPHKLIFTLTHVQDLTHLHMACFCFRPHFRILLCT